MWTSIKRSFAKAMKVDDLADVVLTGGFGIVTIDAVFNSITTYLKTRKTVYSPGNGVQRRGHNGPYTSSPFLVWPCMFNVAIVTGW
jgi:hypothetical protein